MVEEARITLSESEVDSLLQALCVELGFCFQGDKVEDFYVSTLTSAQELTDAVFAASGRFSRDSKEALYPQVRALVAGAFKRAHSTACDSSKTRSV